MQQNVDQAETLIPTKETVLASYDVSDIDNDDEESYADLSWLWSDFVDDFDRIMRKTSKTTKWFVWGPSLTWRNVAGHKFFDAKDGLAAIRKIMPNTSDISIKVYDYPTNKRVMKIVMWHHDRPMGETYYMMSQVMEKKLEIMKNNFPDQYVPPVKKVRRDNWW